jgi:hypothetical protein
MRHTGPYAHAIESLKTCLDQHEFPENKMDRSLAKQLHALYGQSSEVIADWAALAVFADLVRSGTVLLVDRDGLRSRNAFVKEGVDLGVSPDLATALYRYLATRWHDASLPGFRSPYQRRPATHHQPLYARLS